MSNPNAGPSPTDLSDILRRLEETSPKGTSMEKNLADLLEGTAKDLEIEETQASVVTDQSEDVSDPEPNDFPDESEDADDTYGEDVSDNDYEDTSASIEDPIADEVNTSEVEYTEEDEDEGEPEEADSSQSKDIFDSEILDGSNPDSMEYRDDEEENINRPIPVLSKYLKDKTFLPENYTPVDVSVLGSLDTDKPTDAITASPDSRDPRTLEKIVSAMFDNKAKNKLTYRTTQVVALVSGYYASITGLGMDRILEIGSSNAGNDAVYTSIYRAIFDSIKSCSLASSETGLTWKDFLEKTSVLDYETLLYGIYCSTWPGKNPYRVRCPKCGTWTSFNAHNNLIVKYATPEVQDRVSAVLNNRLEDVKHLTAKQINDELASITLMNRRWCVKLRGVDAIVELRIPNLASQLRYYKRNNVIKENDAKQQRAAMMDQLIVSISRIQIGSGNEASTIDTNRIENWDVISKFMNRLDSDDFALINHTITRAIKRRLRILYSLDNIRCKNSKCGNIIKRMELDMETLLFRAISGRVLAVQ
jgi:hypothetical protein